MTLTTRNTLEAQWLTETGLNLPSNLKYEHWEAIGQQLRTMERSVQWWIGDWLNYGERRWGEKYAQAVLETGKSYSTLTKYASVAGRYEVFRRRQTLPWSHHAAVVGLPEEERDAWLDRAENEEWSEGELRGRLRNKAPEEAVVTMTKSRADALEKEAEAAQELKAERETLKAENQKLKQERQERPPEPPAFSPQPKPATKPKVYVQPNDLGSLEQACENLLELAREHPNLSSFDKSELKKSLEVVAEIVGRFAA